MEDEGSDQRDRPRGLLLYFLGDMGGTVGPARV